MNGQHTCQSQHVGIFYKRHFIVWSANSKEMESCEDFMNCKNNNIMKYIYYYHKKLYINILTIANFKIVSHYISLF